MHLGQPLAMRWARAALWAAFSVLGRLHRLPKMGKGSGSKAEILHPSN